LFVAVETAGKEEKVGEKVELVGERVGVVFFESVEQDISLESCVSYCSLYVEMCTASETPSVE
jgi:hypothetical protein